MRQTDVLKLFDYSYWATARLLDAAAKITPEQFDLLVGSPPQSVRRILVHLVSAEWLWRLRIADGISVTAHLTVDDFPTLESIHERWQSEQAAMRAYLATLTDADLDQVIHYKT